MYCRLAVVMAERDPSLSQRQLASGTGLSTATISKLFLNRFDRVDRNTIEKLCEYFDCDISELFVLKEIPSNPTLKKRISSTKKNKT